MLTTQTLNISGQLRKRRRNASITFDNWSYKDTPIQHVYQTHNKRIMTPAYKHKTLEEAQHQDMSLSANLEKLCCYTETMVTFHCPVASLAEKPNTAHMNVAHVLAFKATKHTPWKTLIQKHPERAPEAIAKELASLEKNILERLDENHPEYATTLTEACSGRMIGTEKRSDEIKARGVKQGFKANIAVTDGPNFNYYSHVAKVFSVRTALMRRRRRGRRIAIKDVATAFLQSHKYPPGAMRKYIYFKHPITNEVMYYRQHAPIYGENSTPIHWEKTLFPFLTDGLSASGRRVS